MKYFIFLMLISISLAPALADDQQQEPQMHPEAQAFAERATEFANDQQANLGWTDEQVASYVAEVNTIATEIDPQANLSNFNADGYMNGLESKVQDMLGKFGQDAGSGVLKQEYLEEAANFFVKEFGKDMRDGVTGISTNDYLNDLGRLNDLYDTKLEELTTPPAEPTDPTDVAIFNPDEYLDRAAGGGAKATAKFDFYWGGITGAWLGYNLMALVDAFKSQFSHSSVAQGDFATLQSLWPQSAETYLMNTAYNDGVYCITNPEDPDANQGSYVIDEYGYPAVEGTYEESQFNEYETSSNKVTASYNNRQWGYQNGTFPVASITVNEHKYTLSEHFYTSPLVLDLDGDGEIQASKGVWMPHKYEGARLAEFDMTGDGFTDLTEWVGPNDGLLLVYTEGREVSASDLFGNAGGFAHGFEKLSLLDNDNNKKIEGAELATLSVWRDLNGNAKVDQGEVSSVQDMGITQISLEFKKNMVSHFVQDGSEKKVVDWYPTLFVVKKKK